MAAAAARAALTDAMEAVRVVGGAHAVRAAPEEASLAAAAEWAAAEVEAEEAEVEEAAATTGTISQEESNGLRAASTLGRATWAPQALRWAPQRQ
jgi:uncharacterized protein (UPF0264 family)